MIENKNDASRNLEKALQGIMPFSWHEQAKQRVANEKKKQNEKKRKAENHHKYIMGGIVVKYFSDCYSYEEGGDSTHPPVHCSVPADIIIKERRPKAGQCTRFIRICVAAQRQNVG